MAIRKFTTRLSGTRKSRSANRGVRSRARSKVARGEDPHLEKIAILGKFADSRAVIETACKAMEADEHGADVTTLRLGLRLFDSAYDFLDTTLTTRK